MQELLEENLDSILQDAGVGKNFLTKTLFAQEFRLDKWYLMKLKKLLPLRTEKIEWRDNL